jgi:hypothetical protein
MPGRVPRLLLIGLCLLVLPCLGGVAGVWYFQALQAGDLSFYRALPRPPVPAAALAAGDLNTVYISAADGTVYGCTHRRDATGPACWTPVEATPPLDDQARLDEPYYPIRQPRGTVADSLTVTYRYADASFETHYLLLADGRVLVAEYGGGAYVALAQLIFTPIIGTVLGLLLGGLILIAVAVARRQRRRPANETSLPG